MDIKSHPLEKTHSGFKVTVVTATWNCAETLPVCLESVACQTYQCVEHIIVDGASTDGTVDIIKSHSSAVQKYISEPDRGIYDALNKGVRMASGDIVGFLHADDFFASREVLSMVAESFSDPSVCAVYGDLEYVSKHDTSKVVRRWRSCAFQRCRLGWGWMPPHPTLYVRREWYSRIGGFDISYRISADYLSILQLFSQIEFKAVYLPEVLVKMRLGGVSNRSVRTILNKSKEDWRAMRKCKLNAFQIVRALVWKNLSKLSQFA